MILEAIFNGEIYPAETVVPKSEKFRGSRTGNRRHHAIL